MSKSALYSTLHSRDINPEVTQNKTTTDDYYLPKTFRHCHQNQM